MTKLKWRFLASLAKSPYTTPFTVTIRLAMRKTFPFIVSMLLATVIAFPASASNAKTPQPPNVQRTGTQHPSAKHADARHAGTENTGARHIVSLNLCADQLLLALADREQIAALTQYSRDAEMSFYAPKAQSYPISRGTAEEVLAISPDLIIASPFRRTTTLALLQNRGMRRVDIKETKNLADIYANIRIVADAIGHPQRGEALIRKMEADLNRLSASAQGAQRTAAYYQRRGFLTGTGTLLDDILARVGLINLAKTLNRPPLSRVSLEEIIAARPDFLLLESSTQMIADHGTEMLHHPALDRNIPAERRLYLPQSYTVCGGPSYVAAVTTLHRLINKADKASNIRPTNR